VLAGGGVWLRGRATSVRWVQSLQNTGEWHAISESVASGRQKFPLERRPRRTVAPIVPRDRCSPLLRLCWWARGVPSAPVSVGVRGTSVALRLAAPLLSGGPCLFDTSYHRLSRFLAFRLSHFLFGWVPLCCCLQHDSDECPFKHQALGAVPGVGSSLRSERCKPVFGPMCSLLSKRISVVLVRPPWASLSTGTPLDRPVSCSSVPIRGGCGRQRFS